MAFDTASKRVRMTNSPATTAPTVESFDEVVLPHLDAAYRLARWLMRNEHDAEDVVQEASLRAFRYFRTFAGGNGRAWFLRIVRNTCCGWRGHGVQALTDPFDEEQHSSAQPASDPETLLLQTDDVTLIERAMSNLPDRFRELLVLRELEGLSYRELADVMGIPIGTVMSEPVARPSGVPQCAEQRAETVRHSNEDTSSRTGGRRGTGVNRVDQTTGNGKDTVEASAIPAAQPSRSQFTCEKETVMKNDKTTHSRPPAHPARRVRHCSRHGFHGRAAARGSRRRLSHRHLCPPTFRCQRGTRRSSWVTASAHRTTCASPQTLLGASPGHCSRRRPPCSSDQERATHHPLLQPQPASTPARREWHDSRHVAGLPGHEHRLGARPSARPPPTPVDGRARFPGSCCKAVGTQVGPTGGDTLSDDHIRPAVEYLRRVRTGDGLRLPTDVGKKAFVPYTADYFFYRK